MPEQNKGFELSIFIITIIIIINYCIIINAHCNFHCVMNS